jgi:hypothetical protein
MCFGIRVANSQAKYNMLLTKPIYVVSSKTWILEHILN